MKKLLIFSSIFLIILISASIISSETMKTLNETQGNSQSGNSESFQIQTAQQTQNSGELSESQIRIIQRTQNRLEVNKGESNCPEQCTCTGSTMKCQLQDRREMTITAGNSGNIIFQVQEKNASTKVELYKTDGKIYGIFNGNKTREIKILPDKVQSRLTEKIGGLENHYMDLDEDGNYQIQAKKQARLFGIIPVKEKVQLQMNSQTGEVTRTKTSWWGFLAKDENIVGNKCSTVTPGYNEECCINKGFSSYNQETGECE